MMNNEIGAETMTKREITCQRRYEREKARGISNGLLKGESWKYYEAFLDDKSPRTRPVYMRLFLAFLEWLGYDTEQLFQEYLTMTRDPDPRTVKKMRKKLSDFQDWYAESRGIGHSMSSNIFNCVKGFFSSNELPFAYYSREYEEDPIPRISKEQIQKLIDTTGRFKVKAFVTMLKDTGLRGGDLVKLKIRHIRAILNDRSMAYHTFECKTEKKGQMANPVMGPDSIKYNKMWVDYRVNILGISANDADYLFCVTRTVREFTDIKGRKRSRVIKGERMNSGDISSALTELVRKANLQILPGEKKVPSAHSLRKFCETALSKAKVDPTWINKMTGRKGEGTRGIYNRPPAEDLIAAYRPAYPTLSLTKMGQENEMKKLRQEVAETRQKLAQVTPPPEMKVVMEAIDNLQSQINELINTRAVGG